MDISAINTKPSHGQKIAGNYRKGHVRVHGLDITIENPAGSYRHGIANGKPWKSRLPAHYGYIRGTAGADGDHVDVYLGPHLKSPKVFVVDQHHLGGTGFDEHKCFVGFSSRKQAENAYERAFSDGRGKERIGHVAEMTIHQFRDWVTSGSTSFPVRGNHAPSNEGEAILRKNRAGGGSANLAEGGVPPFDQTSSVPSFDQTQPVAPDAGALDAALHGAGQGATYGFSDELMGARGAAPKVPGTNMDLPDMVGPVPLRTLAGGIRTGIAHITGNDPEAIQNYQNARDAERRAIAAAKKAHPYVYGGAEIAGAIPSMAALPEAGAVRAVGPAATRLARFGAGALDAAITGGEYGAATGAGEGTDAGDRAMNAATGLVSGILGGAASHVAGSAAGALASRYLSPVVSTVRGWFDPNGEAARRLASALRSDQEMISAGTAQGMSPQAWAQARANGEPVTLADLGAGRTQALLRSAANTSPEGRAQLEQVLQDRFLSQGDRFANTVRKAIPGVQADARKSGDQLVAEYDAGRTPAYKAAYADGDRPIMTPTMERLMSSDMVVGAMKRAISSGKDRDTAMGLGGFNPAVNVTADGRIVFNKGASGAPTYPNLQYWDQVKRELDDVSKSAFRSGENGKGDVANQLATTLRNELDSQVPSYANARGIAQKYFGESNALEAGQKLAGKKMDPAEVRQIMRQMKPDERALFQEGYASDLANRVIGNMADTTNLTKGRGLLSNPNERGMASAIFGPGGMAMLQARMHLETIMDGARQAMGNSTTARQLIEAGLAGGVGGAYGAYSSGWDPMKTLEGAGAGAGMRLGASRLLTEEMKVGAKHLIGKVDARTARRVAELLTSNDPNDLRAGYQMAAKNQNIMRGLASVANRVALASQSRAIPYRGPNLGPLQGAVPAGAEEKQQQP